MTSNRLIAYSARDSIGYQNLFFIAPDGTGKTQRTNGPANGLPKLVTGRIRLTHTHAPWSNDDPEFSLDGKQILFSTNRSGRQELWVMKADGTKQTRIAENQAGPLPGDPSWQPIP